LWFLRERGCHPLGGRGVCEEKEMNERANIGLRGKPPMVHKEMEGISEFSGRGSERGADCWDVADCFTGVLVGNPGQQGSF